MFENADQKDPKQGNQPGAGNGPAKAPTPGQDPTAVPPKNKQPNQEVEDMFAEVDDKSSQPGSSASPKGQAKDAAGNNDQGQDEGGAWVIKLLIAVLIFLILGIAGFVVANRFMGFVVFEGLDFLNKPEEKPAIEQDLGGEGGIEEDIMEDETVDDEDGLEEDGEGIDEDNMAEEDLEGMPSATGTEDMQDMEQDMDQATTSQEGLPASTSTKDMQTGTTTDESMNEEQEPEEAGDRDTDGDGLTDKEEQALGTDIDNKDTDGDGLFDGDEYLEYKTNALKKDSDDDGLIDSEEVLKYKTDPLNPDTDGDGYEDGVEVESGYDPTA